MLQVSDPVPLETLTIRGCGAEVAGQFGGRPLTLDVTDAGSMAAAAAAVPELDVLVNNAGISLDTGTRVTETDVEVFRRTYQTNVFGVVAVTNAFLPALRRSARAASRAPTRTRPPLLGQLTGDV